MSITTELFEISDLASGEDFSCQVAFHADHPILQGHFPGNPVVPGAWLIRAVHETLEQITGKKMNMSTASQVKFLAPVLPGEHRSAQIKGTINPQQDGTYLVSATLFHENMIFMKMKASFQDAKS